MTLKQITHTKENTEAQAFFEALKVADSKAIRDLARKISYGTKQAVYNARLSPQDAEELINDALVITIRNIREEKFQFMGISPKSYALGIVRKLIANRLRKKKLATTALSGAETIADFSAEEYVQKKEKEQLIGRLLQKLGEVCQKILKLKYFESYKDEEIIRLQLTSFSTINSLKSKRSQCLKKLTEIASNSI